MQLAFPLGPPSLIPRPTPTPPAAACNLLQDLAHFLRNPLQEPAVQEEKEKNRVTEGLQKTEKRAQF